MKFSDMVRQALGPSDRVMVLGATGWFGTVAIDLATETGAKVLAISGTPRLHHFGLKTLQTHEWSLELINQFSPTVVVDAAFLTREKIVSGRETEYFETNRVLMARAYYCFELPYLRAFIGFSSGAAITEPEKPYGFLKLEYEKELEKLAKKSNINTVVARAWSVSGPFVAKREAFAFTDFIDQFNNTGRIVLKAKGKVHRRYCSIQDLLALCFMAAKTEEFLIVDSGGETIELGALAAQIINLSGFEGQVVRDLDDLAPNNDYFATSDTWDNAVFRFGLETMSVAEQVQQGLSERIRREG